MVATDIRQPPAKTRSASSRVASLDGIRALAILAVIFYHLGFAGWSGGFIGVNVFFVLSGYLITSLLLKEQMQTGSIHLGRFWFRRVLRLYPTLIGVVIVGASLWFLVRSDGASLRLDAGGAALIALTYTGNIARAFGHLSQGVFAPTWSLAMEEQFYLLWPPALLLLLSKGLRRRTIAWVLAVLVVAFSVTSGLLFVPPNPGATPDIYFNPISSAAPLLLGALLALTLTHERARRFFAGAWGRVATWVGFLGIVGLMVQITIEDNWQQEAHVFGLTLPAVALATAFLVAGLVSRPSLLGSVLSWKPLSWFGRNVSYSLYLWHMLVIALLEPFVSGFLGQLVLVAASIAVAIGSHYAIERPFLTVKARFEPASWSAPAKRERELAKA